MTTKNFYKKYKDEILAAIPILLGLIDRYTFNFLTPYIDILWNNSIKLLGAQLYEWNWITYLFVLIVWYISLRISFSIIKSINKPSYINTDGFYTYKGVKWYLVGSRLNYTFYCPRCEAQMIEDIRRYGRNIFTCPTEGCGFEIDNIRLAEDYNRANSAILAMARKRGS